MGANIPKRNERRADGINSDSRWVRTPVEKTVAGSLPFAQSVFLTPNISEKKKITLLPILLRQAVELAGGYLHFVISAQGLEFRLDENVE